MKTKILLIIIGAALFTLSFVTIKKDTAEAKTTKVDHSEEPIGGFISEDAL
jgi:hypothetical protein